MDYKKIYNQEYFSGKNSFFYKFGYNKPLLHFVWLFNTINSYLRKINLSEGNLLDIGCAYGFMLKKFSLKWNKFGIDISKYAIEQAKRIVPQAHLFVGGAEDGLPFKDIFFDLVLMNDVIEHLENPDQAIKNVFNLLKPGGIFFITTPNLNRLRKRIYHHADELEHHISLMSLKKLEKILQQNGFVIIKSWTFTSVLGLFHFSFRSNIGLESCVICRKKI